MHRELQVPKRSLFPFWGVRAFAPCMKKTSGFSCATFIVSKNNSIHYNPTLSIYLQYLSSVCLSVCLSVCHPIFLSYPILSYLSFLYYRFYLSYLSGLSYISYPSYLLYVFYPFYPIYPIDRIYQIYLIYPIDIILLLSNSSILYHILYLFILYLYYLIIYLSNQSSPIQSSI